MSTFDFHTHRLDIPPGTGIVCLSQNIVLGREPWEPHPDGLYAAGIHPWWTAQHNFSLQEHLEGLERCLQLPQVVQLGECGLDRLHGATLDEQVQVLEAQINLAEQYHRPLTLHIVRAFNILLSIRKRHRPKQRWTIHGFRGKPALAQQLLDADFDLSFGLQYNPEAYALTPPSRRHHETDEETDE